MPIVMITNSVRPYCLDVIQVLGLPMNMSHRFRYRSQWISPELNNLELTGRTMLVVLRDFDTGELIPFRHAQVENTIVAGDVNYISFRVSDYYPDSRIQEAAEFIGEQLMQTDIANAPGKQMSQLLMNVDDSPSLILSQRDNDEGNWHNLVTKIGALGCFDETCFLRVLTIQDAKGNVVKSSTKVAGKHYLLLLPGRLYFVNVLQYIPRQNQTDNSIVRPFSVKLIGESDELIFLRQMYTVVGKYDLFQFSFKVPASSQSRYSFIQIEPSDISNSHSLPILYMPIRIEGPWWIRAWTRTRPWLAAISVGSFALSSPIAKFVGTEGELVRTIALFLLIMAAGQISQIISPMAKDTKLSQSPSVD